MDARFFTHYIVGNDSWLLVVCGVAAILEIGLYALLHRPAPGVLLWRIGMVGLRLAGLVVIVGIASLLPASLPDELGFWPLLGALCNLGVNCAGALWLVWHTSRWLVELLQYGLSRAWGFTFSTVLLAGVSLVSWRWWSKGGETLANYATDTRTSVVLLVCLAALVVWLASLDHLDRR